MVHTMTNLFKIHEDVQKNIKYIRSDIEEHYYNTDIQIPHAL